MELHTCEKVVPPISQPNRCVHYPLPWLFSLKTMTEVKMSRVLCAFVLVDLKWVCIIVNLIKKRHWNFYKCMQLNECCGRSSDCTGTRGYLMVRPSN